MEICTIGFAKHSAESFFSVLEAENVRRYFTVSLSEPFTPSGSDRNHHYKLIAGALEVTEAKAQS